MAYSITSFTQKLCFSRDTVPLTILVYQVSNKLWKVPGRDDMKNTFNSHATEPLKIYSHGSLSKTLRSYILDLFKYDKISTM